MLRARCWTKQAFGTRTALGWLGGKAPQLREALLRWANHTAADGTNGTAMHWLRSNSELVIDCMAPPPRAFAFPRDLYP